MRDTAISMKNKRGLTGQSVMTPLDHLESLDGSGEVHVLKRKWSYALLLSTDTNSYCRQTHTNAHTDIQTDTHTTYIHKHIYTHTYTYCRHTHTHTNIPWWGTTYCSVSI